MEKTEFLIVGSPHNIKSQDQLQFEIGTTDIKPAAFVRNLGIVFDNDCTMAGQVRSLCRTLNYQLRNIARIRRYLDEDSCHHVVRALVTSRLDYGNSLLFGITQSQMAQLQRIQNKAVRLIYGTKRSEHVTPYRIRLHWLPVNQRINFKLLVFMYQSVNNIAPQYLSNDIVLSSDIKTHHHALRSQSDHTRLYVPKTSRLYGDNQFSVAGPRLWNTLPITIREAPSLKVFKKLLKTHLFSC